MRGCLGIFVALILALLAAFVVGMGMCITGLGAGSGTLFILSIPAALLTFVIVLLKLASGPPETPPQEQTEPDENQENETE